MYEKDTNAMAVANWLFIPDVCLPLFLPLLLSPFASFISSEQRLSRNKPPPAFLLCLGFQIAISGTVLLLGFSPLTNLFLFYGASIAYLYAFCICIVGPSM